MGSILKHLQELTARPTAMIIPYIKAVDALFRQLLTMLPFEPILAAGIQQILNGQPPVVSMSCYIHLLYNKIPCFTRCPIYPTGYTR